MLPLQKVVLFKHGVGHFEREGQIGGDTAIDLYFRAAEMNDVLKSLTVLDLDGGLITSISYESTLPVAEQLKDIAIQLPQQDAMSGLLAQLQGAHIAIAIGQDTAVSGTVMGIEHVKRQSGETILHSTYISLLVNGNSLQSFDLLEVKQITLLDENLKKDLQHLLEVLIATKKKDLKKLTVFLKGKGERTINISYIVESPVWKTSYRLLLTEKAPLIQGWALVDNTQDEDWENVSLSLVAGLPVSFSHDLYSPRYQQRPVVRVKEQAAYAPPESQPAVETYSYRRSEPEEPMLDDLALGSAVDESEMSVARVAPVSLRTLTLKKAARERSVAIQTRTVEVGDLFQYNIQNPVTVRRQQSALVPILQAGFTGKRVAVYNPEVRNHNPMSAVLFKNTTGLTLESGPMTVFEKEAYVGEAMLNTLKPDEEQLVPFSVELGCIITIDPQSDRQDVHQVRVTHGSMFLYHYELEFKTYIINNNTERDLDLFLEHRFKPGRWELIDTPQPVERTRDFYRFRLDVPSKQTKHFTVTESIERRASYLLQETSRETLKLWIENKYIDKKTLRTLEGIVNLTEQITQIKRDIESLMQEIEAIFNNQERLRQNLQALGTTQDERSLRERYLNSLAKEEDQLAQNQAEIQSLKAQKDTCEKNLQVQINSIELDAKL
jgi:hypothetical protein